MAGARRGSLRLVRRGPAAILDGESPFLDFHGVAAWRTVPLLGWLLAMPGARLMVPRTSKITLSGQGVTPAVRFTGTHTQNVMVELFRRWRWSSPFCGAVFGIGTASR